MVPRCYLSDLTKQCRGTPLLPSAVSWYPVVTFSSVVVPRCYLQQCRGTPLLPSAVSWYPRCYLQQCRGTPVVTFSSVVVPPLLPSAVSWYPVITSLTSPSSVVVPRYYLQQCRGTPLLPAHLYSRELRLRPLRPICSLTSPVSGSPRQVGGSRVAGYRGSALHD